RKQEAEINKEKCKSKIFKYLFTNQGKKHIQVREIKKSIPNPIIMNLPEHFNDILVELLQENNISGKVVGDELFLE
ncbi:unnamed protein product, partial [marine sediment metagenome]